MQRTMQKSEELYIENPRLDHKLCQDLIVLVEDTSREVVGEMMKMHGGIDVLLGEAPFRAQAGEYALKAIGEIL